MGNEFIKNTFDDIEIKVDFLIEFCQTLQEENTELLSKIKNLEMNLNEKKQTEKLYSEQEAFIKSKIDGLLTKLDSFTTNRSSDYQSNG